MIEENCRLSCTELEAITGIPKSTVHEILRSHLELRNVYSVWVPHKLSDNNQAARVSACKELKKLFNAKGMDFMASNYLVENESWFLWDAPEYRRAWIQKKAVKPTIAKQKLTKRKTMVLIAFTCKRKIFSVTVLTQGESVDAQFMINHLKDTGKRFQNLKKNKVTLQELHFQMDNARPHTAAATKFLDRRGVPLVSQSPYSPDRNLLDRFLFRCIKMDLRGEDFSGPEDLSKAIQRSIRHISIKNFIYCIYYSVLLVYLQSLSDALLLSINLAINQSIVY